MTPPHVSALPSAMLPLNGADPFDWVRGQLVGEGTPISTPFGTRRLTYADYIASGRALRWVEETLVQRVLPLYANTHTEDSRSGAQTTQLTHQASDYIKAQLGGDASCKLVFCGSGSTAAVRRIQDILGLSVPSSRRAEVLAQLPPEQRPVVFVGPYEHHSNEVSWRETLAEVVELPLCERGHLDLDALRSALKNPAYLGRPRIGSFSAASNVTGLLTDTRSVARLLHRHGALAFFDFAASAPYTHIDMKPGKPDGYDAVFLSPHKFVGGPGTPGLLCFQEHLYHLTTPSTAGGGTVRFVSRQGHAFVADIEAREDAGTPAILGKLKAALAFKVKETLTPERIEAREHDLIRQAIERLRPHRGLHLLGNLDSPRLAVLSFLVRTPDGAYLHPRLAVRLLNDLFGIQARGGCACAGPYGHALLSISDETSLRYQQCILSDLEGLKPGWVRLNLAPWTNAEELEFLLSAVEFIGEYGHLFVPLYTFDWQSGAWSHASDAQRTAPDLFALPLPLPGNEASRADDYAGYLAQARALALELDAETATVPGRPLPENVPADLVYFAY
ncbi:aminotransferase class V-fold PLP-dependent enzyme [Deinococcus sp. KNUC1210]|uniref:aminotransferase class V-fold PLP-dependent enzyme n=1 Tax=Deinococcus sp. KNUC1210 TaxID=2917691 RepID=UPI001EF07EEB|nr:aminotransferase class V-fold PLP-dependent enzyme [Deinococcus sp. KNUC1210]ULH14484.1 aminotransferase class V-fold PLP-dependent enzyme [Deinococcus sp. KNUC1210]